jgi:aspartyl-tRNA(Asn)/glutamyl-tRNA(Gln) amidotransferase subunit A
VAGICERAAAELESLGCHVEMVSPAWDDPEEVFRLMAAAETFAAWGGRLAEDETRMDGSLVALLRFGETVTAAQYLGAARRRRELWGEVQRFLARFDLLVTPTMPVPAFLAGAPAPTEIRGRAIGPLGWLPFTFPFNLTGQPAATLPVGFTAGGLPVGVQIVGRRHADRSVLAASAALEAALPWHHRRPGAD